MYITAIVVDIYADDLYRLQLDILYVSAWLMETTCDTQCC